jgi:hypothetical protein
MLHLASIFSSKAFGRGIYPPFYPFYYNNHQNTPNTHTFNQNRNHLPVDPSSNNTKHVQRGAFSYNLTNS